jgi:hypothetical protein
MGWSIEYDEYWKRDIGYGVPCYCDHPQCWAEINRGLAHVCGDGPYGGDKGCGLFFCGHHLSYVRPGGQFCPRCSRYSKTPYKPKADKWEWVNHKLRDESWQEWRDENPEEVARLKDTA